ncbi:MAG: hypothetical protein Q9220_007015 [cf. Caloplaca sp. 1 TL-2023]
MAAVSSHGVHRPSALSYLTAEGILAAQARENSNHWRSVSSTGTGNDGDVTEEQLVTTDDCVIWSRQDVVQRIFHFGKEKEKVTQAVFAKFPSQNDHDARPTDTRKHSRAGETETVTATPKESIHPSANAPIQPLQAQIGSERRTSSLAASKRPPHDRASCNWALVVLLKTQAHVFFLKGTSHIVHLPFEVEAIFPLSEGILLQRQAQRHETSWHAAPRSNEAHAVPPNSFVFSQQSFAEASGPQTKPADLKSKSYDAGSIPFSALFDRMLQGASKSGSSPLPRLFSLTDPLSQLGTVGIRRLGNQKASVQQPTNDSGRLDAQEDVLYVSRQDELSASRSTAGSSEPFLLAVTCKRPQNTLTVWRISRISPKTSDHMHHRPNVIASGTLSRRRSSFAPGVGTGATTPVPRGASTRDSFGYAGGPANLSGDLPPSHVDDISSQLDTAFDNPSNLTRTSRRVSSLLARADLSTSHDDATFSELAGGHRAHRYARRGVSLGVDPSASSFSPDTGMRASRSRAQKSIRSSMESQKIVESEMDEEFNDVDNLSDLNAFNTLDIDDSACNLRQEYELKEIYSLHLTSQSDSSKEVRDPAPAPKIFTLLPPISSMRNNDNDYSVFLYFGEKRSHNLLSLLIRVKILPDVPVEALQRSPSAADRQRGSRYHAKVTQTTRLKNVIDACKIQEYDCARVLVLHKTSGGSHNLILHAPWSNPHGMTLPQQLNLYNPFSITTGMSLRQKRDSSFKRVISRGPQSFSTLRARYSHGLVDAIDLEGTTHQLHVQLWPRDPLVKKMIQICEAVMPLAGDRRETVLCAWWAAMGWLQSRPDLEPDVEWTALVVVLFAGPASSIRNWRSETTSRQKRRKGALLRSSSGANTDLESWESMLAQEAGSMGLSPSWMKDSAWQWVTEQSSSTKVQHLDPGSSWSGRPLTSSATAALPPVKKSAYLLHCVALSREAAVSSNDATGGRLNLPPLAAFVQEDPEMQSMITADFLVGLHLLREELKLDSTAAGATHSMTPILAQLGAWLGWEAWSFKEPAYYTLETADMENWLFEESVMNGRGRSARQPFEPPSILKHIESMYSGSNTRPFPTLLDLVESADGRSGYSSLFDDLKQRLQELTPRTIAITRPFKDAHTQKVESAAHDMIMFDQSPWLLETLPESTAAPFRSFKMDSQASSWWSWEGKELGIAGREDLRKLGQADVDGGTAVKLSVTSPGTAPRDVHTVCTTVGDLEPVGAYDGSAEADRQAVTRMLFKDDQRFAEAARLVHPLTAPTARCVPDPAWSDTELLEAQQELVKVVATRTLSVSLGRSLIFYNARYPLLTEKFPIHGFTLSCVMKPSNITVTADRNAYTEEKVSWAFFHAGVEAGLSISKDAKGIDTSWILFNKPHELKNRHAGFLLALGLNGHLKNVAKWVSYKYLTPKHAMTSIGFLLGMAASYLGSMDSNVTRLMSVHVTRMLPPGAAELNLSPLTQTSGVMGIGLLYCNTQHRRMSEIMLSEIENMDNEENATPLEDFRDEGYRLAAGFALGYINLGRGRDLKGLHDMQIVERLLALAIGTKKADLVHILDKATAAAIVAIALIFMKTGDATLARKIDVPETIHQFDYVRPDILLLRTVARHLIMWNLIRPNAQWMQRQLPPAFQHRRPLDAHSVSSQELPYMNILAGLCLTLGLRFAGSAHLEVRDLLCHQLDQFICMSRHSSTDYDHRLTRITARNCQDTVALAAACVMAGTGDLQVFRRLRALHGRTDAETPYGSHLAAHLAIGVLFLGGGTHTFSTSNVAVASLFCAFYPLFPTTVLDNRSHLQAFRHFWVLATEPRCLIVRDINTHRPLYFPMTIRLRNGSMLPMNSPCLLPELDTIMTIATNDPAYRALTLDLAGKPDHLSAMKRHQTIYVRRRAAGDVPGSLFSATMLTLNDAQAANQLGRQAFDWIFSLQVFRGLDRTEHALVLPADPAEIMHQFSQATAIDDCLVLRSGCLNSRQSERLWNLRLLFAWADSLDTRNGRWGWLRKDVVTKLRADLCLKLAARREG